MASEHHAARRTVALFMALIGALFVYFLLEEDVRNLSQFSWSDLPAGTKSLVLLCHDPDVPTRPDGSCSRRDNIEQGPPAGVVARRHGRQEDDIGAVPVAQTGKAFKCDLCGGSPACVAECQYGALVFKEPDKVSRKLRNTQMKQRIATGSAAEKRRRLAQNILNTAVRVPRTPGYMG